MGLFDNYQNINPNYQPNNINPPPNPCKPKLEPCKPNKPYETYNAEGQLTGYFWHYGDTLNLEFDVSGDITYIDGTTYIDIDDYMRGKKVVFTLYDFRGSVMATQELEATSSIIFYIDSELSKKLIKGTYTCTLILYGADDVYIDTLFSQEDGIFEVK